MLAAFPESKVLLTVRDPRKWYASIQRMLSLLYVIEYAVALIPYGRRVMGVARYHFYGSAAGRFGGDMSEANAIRVFNEHVSQVRRSVPAHRLLVFDCTRHGWDELCAFLVRAPNTSRSLHAPQPLHCSPEPS